MGTKNKIVKTITATGININGIVKFTFSLESLSFIISKLTVVYYNSLSSIGTLLLSKTPSKILILFSRNESNNSLPI